MLVAATVQCNSVSACVCVSSRYNSVAASTFITCDFSTICEPLSFLLACPSPCRLFPATAPGCAPSPCQLALSQLTGKVFEFSSKRKSKEKRNELRPRPNCRFKSSQAAKQPCSQVQLQLLLHHPPRGVALPFLFTSRAKAKQSAQNHLKTTWKEYKQYLDSFCNMYKYFSPAAIITT